MKRLLTRIVLAVCAVLAAPFVAYQLLAEHVLWDERKA